MNLLTKPYPCNHSFMNGLKNAVGVSIFLVLFFLIFQPFGLGQQPFMLVLKVSLLYGLATFFAILLVLGVLVDLLLKFFTEDKWEVWNEILLFVLLFFMICIGIHLVNHYWFGDPISIYNFGITYLYVCAVGTIPLGYSLLTRYNRQLKSNLENAQKMNLQIQEQKSPIAEENNLLSVPSENKQEQFDVVVTDFIYAESSANYITIFYLEKEEVKRRMVRTTMKNLVNATTDFLSIFRCHRSFLVNSNHIEKVSGDSRGYEITLKHNAGNITVSRSYIPTLKEVLIIV